MSRRIQIETDDMGKWIKTNMYTVHCTPSKHVQCFEGKEWQL